MNDITALVQRMKQQATLANEFLYVETPNVLALVEALEAKDAESEWMHKRIEELASAREVSEEQRAKWFKIAQELGEKLDVADKHISSLESRAVTVKLYGDFQLCHYGTTEDYAKGYIDCQNNFTKWLAAAGIQVIEGEA